MEDPEAHLFQTRKGHRIEQMVVRWLRRSRDSSSRGKTSTGDSPSIGPNQYVCSLKITLDIKKDPHIESYGFDISRNLPLTVTAVTAGGPAEGKLLPGDQIFAINNENVESIHVEKAADLVRDSGDTVTVTVLRGTSSPKSSFLTAEKRAKLKSNPVKVRFAEEVIVNGHTQGNSLLFMPNVLKVYLENGQTKAFKFEKKTTVKDIVMTLKEKLSINVIEHFALALEEQYSISKLYLLHEDELIEQVVQKKESHDYRCLFRVCFVPKDPLELLQEDPVAFEYLYLQSCSDVLQERFAVEMKCSVALRLAALHIQERIHSCGQPQKITFKYIEKDWGIDNFLSPTLLRNMRGKDIKKAISFHMKRNQCILEPRQKPISAAQVRLQYLKILGDLKTYGGKIFSATLMLQDRESYVTLLVGAKYGISQIINNKLNIMITLAEFSNISKMELTAESEKVSLVKVYLQDVKPLSLLLESNSAKDIACLISGYCKLYVSPTSSILEWPGNNLYHRFSTEEGYESRACSDSEESSELDSSQDLSSDFHLLKSRNIKPLQEEDEEEDVEDGCEIKQTEEEQQSDLKLKDQCDNTINDTDSISENSDSANTESQGYKISWSSDSIDALEEDDLETCSSSKPEFFQFYTPVLKDVSTEDQIVFIDNPEQKCKENVCHDQDPLLCFLQAINSKEDTVSDLKEPSRSPKEIGSREENDLQSFFGCQFTENNVMEYYSLCSNVSPASSVDKNIPSSPESNSVMDEIAEAKMQNRAYSHARNDEVETLILDPPPGFGDSSSEEEFFDATDRFTPTISSPGSKLENKFSYADRRALHGSRAELDENSTEKSKMIKYTKKPTKMIRKRRSFLQTDYTTQVSFPLPTSDSFETMDHVCCFEKESHLPVESQSPTVSSLKDIESEPALLETKSLVQHNEVKSQSKTRTPNLMEMEPDTMETKSVTDSVLSAISAIRFRNESGTTERSHSSYTHTEWNTIEQDGRVSPSEISLQIFSESTNKVSVFCLESTDNHEENKINCINAATMAEENVMKISANILQNDEENKIIKEDIGSTPTAPSTERMLPHIAQSEVTKSSIHNILRVDSESNIKENSQKNGKKRKLFGFGGADLLLDFKGLADLFTNFPKNSFKDGTSTTPCVSPSEEETHLLTSQERNQLTSEESSSVIRMPSGKKQLPEPYLSSSDTMDTLKLGCDNSQDKKDSDVVTLDSNGGYGGHLPYKERSLVEANTNTPRLDDSRNKAFKSNDASAIENECQNYDMVQKSPKISKVGNCSCQLSYVACFQPRNNEIEDEVIDFSRSASPLPRTTPPSSVNSFFVENNHNPKDPTRNNIYCLEHFEALDLLRRRIQDSPTSFGKLQDSVLDLQKIFEEYKDKLKIHPRDKCAAIFSEQKSSLCNVSRQMMSSSQKVLISDQLSEEIYQAVEETYFDLMQMTDVCLQFSSCVGCNKKQMDLQTNLRDLICTYHQFVQAARKASESDNSDLHCKLLSRQCTALTAAIFCLTQQFRSLVSL